MDKEQNFKQIPKQGFIKFSFEDNSRLKRQEDKVALIRKGNELFNKKQYDLAKRIFLTTRYSDGLIRLGDYYQDKNMPLEALRMYWLAQDKKRSGIMLEKIERILRFWLQERNGKNGE